MILSFCSKDTETLFHRGRSKRIPSAIQRVALRKLLQIHAAVSLDNLKIPPGNHLEELKGSRKGQHSIRINDQWRICFRWSNGNARDVEIIDYH
ncbi:MAG TPA: type II toxin-antitoxin system RelE/ParE family toxin [Candidatus Ozemobacteraceae bacterium]|nr:type II toxin-antitoxin system RelE/ParE family toxin [Candidatus Ozemobacteraceae bacterium]